MVLAVGQRALLAPCPVSRGRNSANRTQWAPRNREDSLKTGASLTTGFTGIFKQTGVVCFTGKTTSTRQHALSALLFAHCPRPLTQCLSINAHKHIRTHFHTYPLTDTNKWTHTPQRNGCQDKNNVVNYLEREK